VLLLPELDGEAGVGVGVLEKRPEVNLTRRIRRTASSIRLIGMVPFCTNVVRSSLNSLYWYGIMTWGDSHQ